MGRPLAPVPLHGRLARARRAGTRRGQGGMAALEFALVAPVLLVLAVATGEAVSHLRAWYRLEQAANSAAVAGTRIDNLNTSAVSGLFEAARTVADPYTAWSTRPGFARARTVISAVTNPSGTNVVAWTCSRGEASLTPRVAGSPSLPAGFTVPRGQSVIVVEILNDTAPWVIMAAPVFFGTAGPRPLSAYAIARPRGAEVGTLTGGCP